jgi:transcriptional regulator with XRE-family HTH domain
MDVNEQRRAFGLAVRAVRESLALTQEALASAAALSRSYISCLEAGRENPTLSTQCSIAQALGLSLVDLYRAT